MTVSPFRRHLGGSQCGSSDERVFVRRWRRKKNAALAVMGGYGERGGVKRPRGGEVERGSRTLGCCSKSRSLCIRAVGSKRTRVSSPPQLQGPPGGAPQRGCWAGRCNAPGGSMRHFEFHEACNLGMQLAKGRYPIEIGKVDEGTAAYQQGVPQNSIMVQVYGQRL